MNASKVKVAMPKGEARYGYRVCFRDSATMEWPDERAEIGEGEARSIAAMYIGEYNLTVHSRTEDEVIYANGKTAWMSVAVQH